MLDSLVMTSMLTIIATFIYSVYYHRLAWESAAVASILLGNLQAVTPVISRDDNIDAQEHKQCVLLHYLRIVCQIENTR